MSWVTFFATSSFLSTLPVRGATPEVCQHGMVEVISIHAPREGSDSALMEMFDTLVDF